MDRQVDFIIFKLAKAPKQKMVKYQIQDRENTSLMTAFCQKNNGLELLIYFLFWHIVKQKARFLLSISNKDKESKLNTFPLF